MQSYVGSTHGTSDPLRFCLPTIEEEEYGTESLTCRNRLSAIGPMPSLNKIVAFMQKVQGYDKFSFNGNWLKRLINNILSIQ